MQSVLKMERTLQLLAVTLHVVLLATGTTGGFLWMAYLIIKGNWFIKALSLAYIIYIYFDNKRNFGAWSDNGWKFCRSNFIWKRVRSYFPVRLVKTAELPPNRNYIVACFPHGIIGMSINLNMATDIDKWMELFPNVRPKVATLNVNFNCPFFREIARLWGYVPVSKESLKNFLTKSNADYHDDNRDGFTSNAIAVVVGGAQEALDSRPGQYILTLKKRKGFVKLAIQTGSPIVPSISFGEVDIYDQIDNPPGSLVRSIQTFVKEFTTVSPVILKGRGFFKYFSIIPYRRPITQVLGAPMHVKQVDNPTTEYINEIHEKFISSLQELFETHKQKYLENAENTHLVII